MAELITRIGASAAALLTRLVTPGVGGLMPARPDRVVVDAHTAQAHPEIASTARHAGLPMLIDPQTSYLQGEQYPGDPWARLPFSHRPAPAPGSGFGARPVFIPAIGRSIPKRTVLALLDESTFRPSVICPDPGCCPSGAHALTRDARAHAVNRRRTQLTALADTAHPRWAWQQLGRHASQGLRLARRINALAETPLGQPAGLTKIDLRALHAIQVTADVRRRTDPRRRAA